MRILGRVSRTLLAAMFILGGFNHFRDPAFYLRLMPDYLPAHDWLVRVSGITELVAGGMVLVPRLSMWGARLVLSQLVVFMSVHVWMVQHAERYPDIPVGALWGRIALQVLLIAWAALHAGIGRTLRPVRP